MLAGKVLDVMHSLEPIERGDGVVKDDTKAKSLFEQGCEKRARAIVWDYGIPLMEAKEVKSAIQYFKKGCRISRWRQLSGAWGFLS